MSDKIYTALSNVPHRSGSEEDGEGNIVSWDGYDFKMMFAISLSEFGLSPQGENSLRDVGIINFGYLIQRAKSDLERLLSSDDFEIVDRAMELEGFSYGLSICDNLLSPYELVATGDGLTKRIT